MPVLREVLCVVPASEGLMKAAWIAGLAVAACVAILLADFAVASRRAPRDDKIVKALQEQVKADASLAPKLEAEQKRVTAARRARKARDNAVAWALIAASSLFLICLSWGRPPGLRPAPWPARRVRQAPDSTTKERVRGTRADRGVRPTICPSWTTPWRSWGGAKRRPSPCFKPSNPTTAISPMRLCIGCAS